MTDPAKIAAGLTKAQRETMLQLTGAWKFVTQEEVAPLKAVGLAFARASSFGGYAARLTPLGQQVAAILRENENG